MTSTLRDDSDDSLVPGQELDGYRLICLLGRGGMGEVWLAALDGTLGIQKLVALKTLSSAISGGVRFRRLFLDEARVAARISHPNVVPVLRMGEAQGRLYYAMEWVDGESLRALKNASESAGKAVPPGIAARIIADVCVGLHAAHEVRDLDGRALDVVHRDVSPQNILLTDDGIPRVIDFGIAKARTRVSETTRPGGLLGKLAYMAPEQVSGAQVDRRTDVWGAGAVLHELVTGHPVFPEDVAMHRLAVRARPELEGADLPPALRGVLARALEPDPAARFPSAQAMALALEDALRVSGLSTAQRDVGEFAASLMGDRRRERQERIRGAIAALRAVRGAAPADATSPTALEPERPAVPPGVGPEPAASSAVRALRRRRLGVVLGAIVVSCAALAARATLRSAPSPPSATGASTSSSPAPAPTSGPQAGAVLPAGEPSGAPPAAPSPSRTTGESPSSAPPPASPSGPRSDPRRTPAARTPDRCSPPYTIDREGFRKYKAECL